MGVGKRRALVAAALGAVICVGGVLAYHSFLGRAVLGLSTIVVVNDSGGELTHVRVVLSTAQSTAITRTFPRISTGERGETAV